MKVNATTTYGLLAVGYIARNQDKGLVISQNIAKHYNIDLEYLFKTMQQLVRANLLRSKRGPRGGFSLAKSPSKITMLDIIEAVEGPLTSDLVLSDHAPRDKFAARAEKSSESAFKQARNALKAVKLSDLL
ncbi:MAG: Rrf2 family transcriptional regulator [Planctomycetota bacterium]|nr:MAG: Rrf2 family transcriptional regulator [Planctomycetota bacterium]